jgi:DNA segregation ATPase FtsK/SpoIIIE, S-DNA-T family
MDHNELIGGVAAAYFTWRLNDFDTSSTARYLLDSLTADQTAAIAKSILANSTLEPQIEMKFPAQWLKEFDLPDQCLTEERATYYRNAFCAKPVLLIATPGDDERQSLADLIIIDSNQLRSHVHLWVEVAAGQLPLTEQHRRWWQAALTGLQDVTQVTLDRFARYVLETRTQIEDGRVFLDALGEALPTLHWPRNPAMFRSLNEKTAGHVSKWKALFQQVQRRQACYLKKYTPNNQLLSADDLKASFDKVKDVIPDKYHRTIHEFIASLSKWNREADAVARIEWETVKPLFDGLRPEPFNLGKATLKFYEEHDDGLLKKEEREYLEALAEKRGKTSETIEDDVEFYRNHRGELKNDPNLKSKWDKFIFGSQIETTDLLVGIAMSLDTLFDTDIPEGAKRELRISSDKKSKNDLKKLNVDAGRYFAFRYRGLRDLFGLSIFDVGSLFDYDKVQTEWVAGRKYKPNVSTARAALEIKFYIELSIDDGAVENHRQLIWRFEPNAIGTEIYGDWLRLTERPLTLGEVNRESVGQKGQPQPLDLRNVKSLSAAFSQDRGSLVPVYRRERDLGVVWKRNLNSAVSQGSISAASAAELDALFEEFLGYYKAAIATFAQVSVAAGEIESQYKAYGRLLEALTLKAKSDRNRELLLKPLLSLGVVPVYGAAPAAIVAPWNPFRMQAMASKADRMARLVLHLLKAPNVLFGDASLYFKEMRDELEHPYFPEIALGWRERKPELLSMTDACMDYSPHELPLADDSADADTNENPTQSANQIVEMIQRYLALFPHEQANLSVVLYNCDAASLPQAVVNRINDLHEDDNNMRCEVILRHRDRTKLHKALRIDIGSR